MAKSDPKKTVAMVTDLVPGVLATAALGGTFFALHLPVVIAVGAAAAVYGGTRLLMSAATPDLPSGGDNTTALAIKRGRDRVLQIRSIAQTISKDSVRGLIGSICSSADQIFGIFEDDPRKAPLASGFVDYTLSQTTAILGRYRDLSSRGVARAQGTLEKTETLLVTIDGSFKEQIERLLMEDVADLDSEIDVLKARLDFEGENLS